MSRLQFLTYRWGQKYETHNVGTYGPQVKEGGRSLNDEIHRGNYKQTSAGTEWWGESGFGSDNASDAQADGRYWQQVDTGRNQKGLAFWMQTNSNGKTSARWFDIGAEGGKTDGTIMEAQARSCWLRDVTGVWFLFNSHDTTETRDCYSRVERVALRYVDQDRRIRFLTVTEKMADLQYMGGHRGSTKRVFGYQLDSTARATVVNNRYRLLGLRVQFQLKRGASGTHTDYIQAGMTGLRFTLGDCNTPAPPKTVLCGVHNQVHSGLNENKLQLEI